MASESKKIKRIIGGSLIIISGITLFYQYKFSKVQQNSQEYVVISTKKIEKDEELTNENIKLVLRDKKDIGNENLDDIGLAIGSIAKEVIYENENININRIISKEDYEKKNYRLISIKVNESKVDPLVGYEVRPGDKVDILYYDKSGIYEGKPYLQGVTVYDLKSVDGVSYEDMEDTFVPAYALIWVEKNIAEEIYARQEEGGYFKFQLQIDRISEENNKELIRNNN